MLESVSKEGSSKQRQLSSGLNQHHEDKGGESRAAGAIQVKAFLHPSCDKGSKRCKVPSPQQTALAFLGISPKALTGP